MEVVEREAQARGGAPRTRRAAAARAPARPAPRLAVARRWWAPASLLAALVGFGDRPARRRRRRRPHASSPTVEPERAAATPAAACGSRATASDGAILRVHGMPALRRGRSTRCGSSATGDRARADLRRRRRRRRRGRGAGRPVRRRRGARHPRAARRLAGAERAARCSRSALVAAARFPRVEICYRHPDRETGVRARTAAADLPGLHDLHAGRDALPRVRAPADAGRAASARPATSRR